MLFIIVLRILKVVGNGAAWGIKKLISVAFYVYIFNTHFQFILSKQSFFNLVSRNVFVLLDSLSDNSIH